MSGDDEAARKERAKNLRSQISRLKEGAASDNKESCPSEESQEKSDTGKSPRDFINERMRERDKEES